MKSYDRKAILRKAEALWSVNDRAGARAVIADALSRTPDDLKLVAGLARMDISERHYARAESCLREALDRVTAETRPDILAQLTYMLLDAVLEQGKLEDAWALLSAELPTRLEGDDVKRLRAHLCRYTRRYDEAERLYRDVLSRNPAHDKAMRELTELLSLRGRFDEAERLHHRLVALKQNPAYNARLYSHMLLAQERVKEGWAHYMRRAEHAELKALDGLCIWNGSPLDGRSLFVFVEGGTGDELRDASCYEELSRIAGRVTITCDPRFETLFRRSFPRVQFRPLPRRQRTSGVPRHLAKLMDEATLEEAKRHDFSILSPDLFHYLKPTAADYGLRFSYLAADSDRLSHWRRRLAELGESPKIGIGWSTIRQTYQTASCYTKLADWQPILSTPGVVFVSLQYGDCEQELAEAEKIFGVRIHRWPDLDLLDDFESVAALTCALDLVLAPNTTTLELAGALGVRAWYMVNEYQTLDHWRLKDRATGQDRLYPSVKIFMASQPGDSRSLIAQVAAALRKTFGPHQAVGGPETRKWEPAVRSLPLGG